MRCNDFGAVPGEGRGPTGGAAGWPAPCIGDSRVAMTETRVESAGGSFSPSPACPSADEIKAEYRDGVLQVTLPQREKAQPNRIAMAVSR
jgi:hypothetical protein